MSAAAIVALVLGAVGITSSLVGLAFTLGRKVEAILRLTLENTTKLEQLSRRVARIDKHGSRASRRAASAAERAASTAGRQLYQGAVMERQLSAIADDLERIGNGESEHAAPGSPAPDAPG